MYGDPKWDPKAPMVPVDEHGNMSHYKFPRCTWQREFDFFAQMKLVDWERGQSAARFILAEQGGPVPDRRYPVFMTDFYWIVRNRNISNGIVEKTWWTFAKQGSNYGVKLR